MTFGPCRLQRSHLSHAVRYWPEADIAGGGAGTFRKSPDTPRPFLRLASLDTWHSLCLAHSDNTLCHGEISITLLERDKAQTPVERHCARIFHRDGKVEAFNPSLA